MPKKPSRTTLEQRLSQLASEGNYQQIAAECSNGELRKVLLRAASAVKGKTVDPEDAVSAIVLALFDDDFTIKEPNKALAYLVASVRNACKPSSRTPLSSNATLDQIASSERDRIRRPEAHEWCRTPAVVYLVQHCPEVLPSLAVAVIRILNELDDDYVRHVTPLLDGKTTLTGQRLMAKYLNTSSATITRTMEAAKTCVASFYTEATQEPISKASQLVRAATSHDLKTQFESSRFVPTEVKDILRSPECRSTLSASQLLAAAVMMDYARCESDMEALIDAAGKELDRLQAIRSVLRARHLETRFREDPTCIAMAHSEIDAVIHSLKQSVGEAPDDLTALCWLHEGILERFRQQHRRAAAIFRRAQRISDLPLELRASLTHQQAVLQQEANHISKAITLFAETLRCWDAFDRKAASRQDKRRSQHRRIYTFRRLATCLSLQADQRKNARKQEELLHAAEQFDLAAFAVSGFSEFLKHRQDSSRRYERNPPTKSTLQAATVFVATWLARQ